MHLTLSIPNLRFEDLSHPDGLHTIDRAYLSFLSEKNPALHQQLETHRAHPLPENPVEHSAFLIELAKTIEAFITHLFQIDEAVSQLSARTLSHDPIFQFKTYFVQKRAKKALQKTPAWSFEELSEWLDEKRSRVSIQANDLELQTALFAQTLMQSDASLEDQERLTAWCVYVLQQHTGTSAQQAWVSFLLPEKIDPNHLIHTAIQNEMRLMNENELTHRIDFRLTDPRMNEREIANQVDYCIYCHDHDGDFCSKGFPQKKGDPSQGFRKNAHDLLMVGCPLEEKISEMHLLRKQGFVIGALAMIMLDNPMCPATGHRICNDCMKACIYQKQEPVNIPQIETRTLTDTLHLPWGVEIYHLLCVWNPLRKNQWIMKPYNGLKSMIAGMGPAGFTLAHHLLMEGFGVVGFDGLRIEPLPEHLISKPIYQFNDLIEPLNERIVNGFGGVAEYGITVRWDKNFLKLIYLTLSRRSTFQVFGSTRFGGTITIPSAWKLGFDHFTVAVGAGLPKALNIPNSLAPGMRQANDFLMALHLGNAAKSSSLNTFQIRLPALVIGGGLTGVDTATELQAYYIAQVERVLHRYTELIQEKNENEIRSQFSNRALIILDEFLEHARLLKQERALAIQEKRLPNLQKFIRAWGGVTIVYRKTMQASPAYIHNHEELKHALKEGIFYREELEPAEAVLDEYGFISALKCKRTTSHEIVHLPARSILVATGTRPNTAYEFEHKGTFERQHQHYQHYELKDNRLHSAHGALHCKETEFGALTSHHSKHKYVSLIGDTHPVFHGNVVKAIASGLRTYPKILSLFEEQLKKRGDEHEYALFNDKINALFDTRVISIKRIAEHKLDVVIHAPLSAEAFQAGQFYRLQNLESKAPVIHATSMQMEGLIVTPYFIDKNKGNLHFTIIQDTLGGNLCDFLNEGDPVSLMGPTGVRAKVSHEYETVLIIGGHHAFSFAESYGRALKEAGNRVMMIAYFDSPSELHRTEELKSVLDHIEWIGNEPIENALERLTETLQLADVDRLFVWGSTALLRTIQQNQTRFAETIFLKNPKILGNVQGNMQCMLKGVCAQCLQWQIDPETGERTKAVFACSWQDQPIELIDLHHTDERSVQNNVLETVNALWLKRIRSFS